MRTDNTFTLPATNTLEENAKLWAENASKNIKPGHGLFFDFKAVPELEKPVIDYFVNILGWSLDYNDTFIRKPENKADHDTH